MKRPHELLEEVQTIRQAQSLYRRLGKYLSGDVPRGGPTERASRDPQWRREAKIARRMLERDWGDTVRLTSSSFKTTSIAEGGKRPERTAPTWASRGHFTLPKPRKVDFPAPHILHVPLDPETLEPLGAFPRLAPALERAGELRRSRQRIAPNVHYKDAETALLRERAMALSTVTRNLEEELRVLTRESERLKQEIDRRTGQRATAGRARGAGAGVWDND